MKTFVFTALAVVLLATNQRISPAEVQDDHAGIRVRAPFVAVDVGIEREQRLTGDKPERMSRLVGMTVRNAQHEELGRIEDFVLGTRTGQIRYAALSLLGDMGQGEQLAAIPWKSLRFQYDKQKNEPYFVLDVDKEVIRQYPRFDSNHWPELNDSTMAPDAVQESGNLGGAK